MAKAKAPVRAKKKMPPVNPKPAAKVDDAAKVLLAPKPPPPFRSATPPRTRQWSNVAWYLWIFGWSAFIVAGLAALAFLNYWPN